MDSAGVLIRTDGIGNNYSVSTGWTAFGTHQAPPPSNAVTARLRLYGGGTASTIFVDDITIAAVPVANQGDIWSYPNIHGDIEVTANSQAGETTPVTVIYDPFGQTVNVPDNSAGNFDYGWLGQQQRPLEHQGGLATIEMGARPYLPATGRFLAVDPIEGGTPNDYTYPTDPINTNDTTGQSCFAMDANGFLTLRGKGALHGDQDNWCTGAFKKFINGYTGRGTGGGGGDILGMVGHATAGLGRAIGHGTMKLVHATEQDLAWADQHLLCPAGRIVSWRNWRLYAASKGAELGSSPVKYFLKQIGGGRFAADAADIYETLRRMNQAALFGTAMDFACSWGGF